MNLIDLWGSQEGRSAGAEGQCAGKALFCCLRSCTVYARSEVSFPHKRNRLSVTTGSVISAGSLRAEPATPVLCSYAHLPQVYALCDPCQNIEAIGRRGKTGDRSGAHDLLLKLVLEKEKASEFHAR